MMSINPSEKYLNSLKKDIQSLENFTAKVDKQDLLEWVTMEFGGAWMDLNLSGLEDLDDGINTTTE